MKRVVGKSCSIGWRSCTAYGVGHFVPTTAVLTPAAGLQTRCAQTGRPLTTPLALRSSGDDSEGSAATPNAGALR